MKIQGLYSGQGIYKDENITKELLNKHKISTKLIGVSTSTKNNKEFLDEPNLIDKYAMAYLYKSGLLDLMALNPEATKRIQLILKSPEFLVYNQLKESYFLIDGHKFGGEFLAYDNNPQQNHAKYLIFVVRSINEINYNKMTRLSEICKKTCLCCSINQQSVICQVIQREKEKGKAKKQKVSQKLQNESLQNCKQKKQLKYNQNCKQKKQLKYNLKKIKFQKIQKQEDSLI